MKTLPDKFRPPKLTVIDFLMIAYRELASMKTSQFNKIDINIQYQFFLKLWNYSMD